MDPKKRLFKKNFFFEHFQNKESVKLKAVLFQDCCSLGGNIFAYIITTANK